jgi:hypothetical protein
MEENSDAQKENIDGMPLAMMMVIPKRRIM